MHTGDAARLLRSKKMALLQLDALALRAIEALRAAGVDALLLKGPTTATWLYDDPLEHIYTDVDLLVPPQLEGQARRVLSGDLGLADHHAGVLRIYRPVHESAWVGTAGVVDLHVGLAEQPSDSLISTWDLLWSRRRPFDLRGATVPAPDVVCRAFHVTLHAAGAAPTSKAARDLDRLLQRLDRAAWWEVAEVARVLDLEAEFGEGLVSSQGGQVLAGELGLTGLRTVRGVLAERGALPEAIAVSRALDLGRGLGLREALRWCEVSSSQSRGRVARRRAIVCARLPRAFLQALRARRVVRATSRRRRLE